MIDVMTYPYHWDKILSMLVKTGPRCNPILFLQYVLIANFSHNLDIGVQNSTYTAMSLTF